MLEPAHHSAFRVTPIHTLPSEIISEVFHIRCSEPFPDDNLVRRRRRRERLGWIREATHVCGRWRRIALADAGLWGRGMAFHLTKAATQELLLRSRTAPLLYEISGFRYPALSYGGKIKLHSFNLKNHLDRVQSITLHITDANSATIRRAIRNMTTRATQLQVLDIITNHHPSPELPANLFDGHAPQLRVVRLHSITLSWQSFLFSTLEELSVDCYADRGVTIACPTQTELRSILERLPQLKVLVLAGCLPLPIQQSTNEAKPIELAHLEVLRIRGTASECSSLFDLVNYPSSCNLSASCLSGFDTAESMTSYVSTFLQREPSLGPIHYLRLFADCSDDIHYVGNQAIIEGWHSLPDPEDYAWDISEGSGTRPAFRLSFTCDFDSLDQIPPVLHSLPLRDVRVLRICGRSLVDDDDRWPDYLTLFKAVEHLTVRIDITGDGDPSLSDLNGFSRALRLEVCAPASAESVPRLPILPRLVSLRIFDEDGCGVVYMNEEFKAGRYTSTLLDALQTRQEEGHAIKKIVLDSWYSEPEEAWMKRLRGIVPEVLVTKVIKNLPDFVSTFPSLVAISLMLVQIVLILRLYGLHWERSLPAVGCGILYTRYRLRRIGWVEYDVALCD
jgi:hypothetical protein